jgi:cytochrome c-type biogenesis protein CcmH/NrfG
LRYPETLHLVEQLPVRRPGPGLHSRLGEYFERLPACPQVEDAIWSAWMHDGHELAERSLDRAASDIAARRFDVAQTRLAQLVRRRPDWAEAWNKLGTLYYLQNRDDDCVAALHRALAVEPRHFGALATLGEILRAQGDAGPARLAFGRALRLHPHLGAVREALRELSRC